MYKKLEKYVTDGRKNLNGVSIRETNILIHRGNPLRQESYATVEVDIDNDKVRILPDPNGIEITGTKSTTYITVNTGLKPGRYMPTGEEGEYQFKSFFREEELSWIDL